MTAAVASPGWDRWREALDRFGWAVFGVIGLYYCGVQVSQHGFDLGAWDLMRVSAWFWLAFGFDVAQQAPRRVHQMIERLQRRGALDASDEEVGQVLADVDHQSSVAGVACGGVSAVMLLVAHLARGGLSELDFALVLLGAFGGGFHLGRGASYGRVGWLLRRRGCMVRVVPGHVDGVGGLKPVGEFYFFQAKIAALPALYLILWLLLIPAYTGDRYDEWRGPMLGFLAFVLAIEVLSFVVPTWAFHQEMSRQKAAAVDEADRLSFEIAGLQRQLVTAAPEEATGLRERLAGATERYQTIEDMPTWPVDVRTRRQFRLGNIALFVPLVGKALGSESVGRQVQDVLNGL